MWITNRLKLATYSIVHGIHISTINWPKCFCPCGFDAVLHWVLGGLHFHLLHPNEPRLCWPFGAIAHISIRDLNRINKGSPTGVSQCG